MKNSTKFILGGLALGATAAVTGAAYVNNIAIPNSIAAQIDAAYADAAAKHKPLGDAARTQLDGRIVVKATGILSYEAHIPQISVANNKGQSLLTIAPASYDISTNAGNSAIKLTAQAPVTFAAGDAAALSATGTCRSTVIEAKANGNAYELAVNAAVCFIEGNAVKSGTNAAMNAHWQIHYTLSNDGRDNFTSATRILLSDVTANIQNPTNPRENIQVTAENITVDKGYTALPAGKGLQEVLTQRNIAAAPDSVYAKIDVTGVNASLKGAPLLEQARFGAELDLKDIKGNRAQLKGMFHYKLGTIKSAEFAALAQGLPTVTVCSVDARNIPLTDLAKGDVRPGVALRQAEFFIGAGCDTGLTGVYTATTRVLHHARDGGLPGEGRLEIKGLDAALNALNGGLGRGLGLSQLTPGFTALAVPTEDGKGLKWDYKMDKDGMVTVNGHNVGMGVPRQFLPR